MFVDTMCRLLCAFFVYLTWLVSSDFGWSMPRSINITLSWLTRTCLCWSFPSINFTVLSCSRLDSQNPAIFEPTSSNATMVVFLVAYHLVLFGSAARQGSESIIVFAHISSCSVIHRSLFCVFFSRFDIDIAQCLRFPQYGTRPDELIFVDEDDW